MQWLGMFFMCTVKSFLFVGANVRGLSKFLGGNWFVAIQDKTINHFVKRKFVGKGNPRNPRTLISTNI